MNTLKNMHNFTKEYFDKEYHKSYFKKNPPYKLNAYLKRILLYKSRGTLLDVGCAYGSFLNLASEYFQCTGIDISKHAISVAKKKANSSAIKFLTQSAERIQLTELFDVITCFDVLEHLPSIDKSLATMRKYLKNNGILVVVVPVYDGVFGKIVRLLDQDKTHIQKHSRGFWLEKIKINKFTIKEYQGIFRYFFGGLLYVNSMSSITKEFSSAIFLILQKK